MISALPAAHGETVGHLDVADRLYMLLKSRIHMMCFCHPIKNIFYYLLLLSGFFLPMSSSCWSAPLALGYISEILVDVLRLRLSSNSFSGTVAPRDFSGWCSPRALKIGHSLSAPYKNWLVTDHIKFFYTKLYR